jgi:fibronectin type 3 domain-containing protein
VFDGFGYDNVNSNVEATAKYRQKVDIIYKFGQWLEHKVVASNARDLDVADDLIARGVLARDITWEVINGKNRITGIYANRCNLRGTLDISNLSALNYIDCGGNQLESIIVFGCTALKYLACYENQLTSLNVSSCTALSQISCNDNQLMSLDVSNNTALAYLWCDNNRLTSLDVSKNVALAYFDCHNNNQLKTVYVPIGFKATGAYSTDTGVVLIEKAVSITLGTPTNFKATATGNNVKLTWNAVNGAAAYYIYRSADGGKTFTQVSTRLAKNFGFSTPYFDDVVGNGAYIYAVRAYDASLSKNTRSDEAKATVTVGTVKLEKPTVTATKPTANSVKLNWSKVAGATSYTVYRSADGGKTYQAVAPNLPARGWTDANVANGSYTYVVRGFNGTVKGDAGTVDVTVGKLAKPTVTARNLIAYSVRLTWNAVPGAAAYYIYRSTDGGKTFVQISTRLAKNFNGKTPYFDDVAGSGSYIYAIRAYDSSLSKDTRSDEVRETVTVWIDSTGGKHRFPPAGCCGA